VETFCEHVHVAGVATDHANSVRVSRLVRDSDCIDTSTSGIKVVWLLCLASNQLHGPQLCCQLYAVGPGWV
jgi:hypothetical protein